MDMEDGDRGSKDTRYRVRLTIKPELAERIERVANVLSVDKNTVSILALSLGVRALGAAGMVDVPPAIAQAMAQTSEDHVQGAATDANVKLKK